MLSPIFLPLGVFILIGEFLHDLPVEEASPGQEIIQQQSGPGAPEQ